MHKKYIKLWLAWKRYVVLQLHSPIACFYSSWIAKMSNAKLTNAKMADAKIANAKMANAKMINAKMANAKMVNANWHIFHLPCGVRGRLLPYLSFLTLLSIVFCLSKPLSPSLSWGKCSAELPRCEVVKWLVLWYGRLALLGSLPSEGRTVAVTNFCKEQFYVIVTEFIQYLVTVARYSWLKLWYQLGVASKRYSCILSIVRIILKKQSSCS